MQLWFWIWLGIILKLPVLWTCWYVYKTIKDVPEQVLGDDDGGQEVKVVFDPGPRTRGPGGGLGATVKSGRRGDPGHEETPAKTHPQDHRSRA